MSAATGLFFSGGKDSFWCLQQDLGPGPVELITTIDADSRRVPIQGIREAVVLAQAAALNLPIRIIELPTLADNPTYKAALHEAVKRRAYGQLVFGDLHLQEIRDFRERQFADLPVRLRFPLWGRDTRKLAAEMIAGGLQATLCSVNPGRVAADQLGRSFDRQLLAELPSGVDPCGENGEFHTVVTGGPGMASIELRAGAPFEQLGHQVLDYEP